MGSVKYRMAEARRNECNVVLVGDVRVGKSALVNRFINNKFTEVSQNFMVIGHFPVFYKVKAEFEGLRKFTVVS